MNTETAYKEEKIVRIARNDPVVIGLTASGAKLIHPPREP